ncbi:hypothetical protein [Photorhabdus sp. CRCIA-P01]|uniref:hypothetical protein n=1 Tax=Photorhabdus sp. CRCIA-P01 TaxID=2019570 RepID=UPI001E5D0E5B|nr:hypothetical protein [Photorhabdus sp. CRCIA-P01]
MRIKKSAMAFGLRFGGGAVPVFLPAEQGIGCRVAGCDPDGRDDCLVADWTRCA